MRGVDRWCRNMPPYPLPPLAHAQVTLYLPVRAQPVQAQAPYRTALFLGHGFVVHVLREREVQGHGSVTQLH